INLQLDAVATGDFSEAFLGVVEKLRGRNRFHFEAGFGGFDACQSQQILREPRHTGRILANDFEKLAGGRDIVGSAVEQCFRIALNRRERRTQLVGNVGDEVAPGFFDALGFGEVAKHGDGASIGQRGGGYVEGAAVNDGGGAGRFDFAGGRRFFHGGEEIGVADSFDYGLVQAGAVGGPGGPKVDGPPPPAGRQNRKRGGWGKRGDVVGAGSIQKK